MPDYLLLDFLHFLLVVLPFLRLDHQQGVSEPGSLTLLLGRLILAARLPQTLGGAVRLVAFHALMPTLIATLLIASIVTMDPLIHFIKLHFHNNLMRLILEELDF